RVVYPYCGVITASIFICASILAHSRPTSHRSIAMGRLVKGIWHDEWYDTGATGGAFVREDAGYRQQIEEGGRFPPESGRYHLYVSLACPWAHRTLILRKLKGLEAHIGVTA